MGSSLQNIETDVIVLGVGTCGEDLSLRLLGAGLDVVGIEASLVGGECAYWACLPSKMMIRAANLLQEGRRAEGKAGKVSITADWDLLASRVRQEVTGGWDDSYAVNRYQKNGGTLIHGYGKLQSKNSVTVNDKTIIARRGIVIATGSRPSIPDIEGLSDIDYWTTHEVISAEKLPASLVVLGGGAVGCELGQLLSRFGVKVTIIEAANHILPKEEPEAGETLGAALIAEGIDVLTGTVVQNVTRKGNFTVCKLEDGNEVSSEQLLVAAGRRVDLSVLGLENIGLKSGAEYLKTDENMQVSNGIWAMGDITGVAMFTHVALYQSGIVASQILGIGHPPANYDILPRAVFTDPEVGAVGLTEAQARARGLDVQVLVKQLPASFRGWLHGVGYGIIKFVIDKKNKHLLGATSAGPHAAEMLGFFSLAIKEKITINKLQHIIYAFPTFYGVIGEALGAYGRGLATVIDPGYNGFKELDKIL